MELSPRDFLGLKMNHVERKREKEREREMYFCEKGCTVAKKIYVRKRREENIFFFVAY